MDYEKLTERKKRILNAVIDNYIDNAEPVSSNEIKSKYIQDISSATIRSELSALEEMGFLIQPHTSSGRIPSVDAYKFYVEKLLTEKSLALEEIELISSYFDNKILEVDELIKTTAKIISDITNYTSIILLDDISLVKLRNVKLVDIGDGLILVVIVTDSGIISDKTIKMKGETAPDYLNTANSILNNALSGKTLNELQNSSESLNEALGEYKKLFNEIIKILYNYCNDNDKKIFLEGTSNLLKHKEYNDLEETRNLLSIISEKEKLRSLIENNDIEFNIKIGNDAIEGVKHCAMITTKYSIKGGREVKAGVIGPDRMNYKKVKAVLNYVGEMIKTITDENKCKEDDDEQKQK